MRSTIICVDDEKLLLSMLYEQLNSWFGNNYNVEKAQSGEEALKILDNCLESGKDVSVFISDYIMPIMKGDELLIKVRERDPRIKRIMLTGYSAIDGIINAINKAGIYRYILKPWDSKDLMLTLLEAIKSYEKDKVTAELSKNYETLYYKYENLYNENYKNFDDLLNAFSIACDLRDSAKPNHSHNVARYSEIIGTALSMEIDELKVITQSALLHDVGKLAMTDDELNRLKNSHRYSADAVSMRFFQANFSERILENIVFVKGLCENIKYQFETMDGTGPFKLEGNKIPLGAKILHIANLYDIVASRFKKATLKEKVVEFVNQGQKHLDNHLTSLFVEQLRKLEKIE